MNSILSFIFMLQSKLTNGHQTSSILINFVIFQYLIKYNDIKTKKGIELLQHLVEFYHAQNK